MTIYPILLHYFFDFLKNYISVFQVETQLLVATFRMNFKTKLIYSKYVMSHMLVQSNMHQATHNQGN